MFFSELGICLPEQTNSAMFSLKQRQNVCEYGELQIFTRKTERPKKIVPPKDQKPTEAECSRSFVPADTQVWDLNLILHRRTAGIVVPLRHVHYTFHISNKNLLSWHVKGDSSPSSFLACEEFT